MRGLYKYERNFVTIKYVILRQPFFKIYVFIIYDGPISESDPYIILHICKVSCFYHLMHNFYDFWNNAAPLLIKYDPLSTINGAQRVKYGKFRIHVFRRSPYAYNKLHIKSSKNTPWIKIYKHTRTHNKI